jgi:hypothetical protein
MDGRYIYILKKVQREEEDDKARLINWLDRIVSRRWSIDKYLLRLSEKVNLTLHWFILITNKNEIVIEFNLRMDADISDINDRKIF